MKKELLMLIFLILVIIFGISLFLFPNNARPIATVALLVIMMFMVVHNSNKMVVDTNK